MATFLQASAIDIIPVPSSLGVWRHYGSGVTEAPQALLQAGLVDSLRRMGWSVNVQQPVSIPDAPRIGDDFPPNKKQLISVCRELKGRVESSLRNRAVPLTLGGDHSIAIGSIGAASAHAASIDRSLGVIWMDAHPDMNTPVTSPTLNIHGMPLACCVELGSIDTQDGQSVEELSGLVKPKLHGENVCLVGARDVDRWNDRRGEREVIDSANVRLCGLSPLAGAQEVRRVMDAAVLFATGSGNPIHLSFDLDFVDPTLAPAVGTPVPGGANVEGTFEAIEVIRKSETLLSVDLVEIHTEKPGADETMALAIQCLTRLFRK